MGLSCAKSTITIPHVTVSRYILLALWVPERPYTQCSATVVYGSLTDSPMSGVTRTARTTMCPIPMFEYIHHITTTQTSQFYTPLCVSRIQVPRSMRSHRVDRDKSMGSHHLIMGDHQPITTQSGGHPSSF